MSTDIEPANPIAIDAATLESVVVDGNLAQLSEAQRLAYYRAVCDSVGLNPLTKPFDYITLSGRLTLYARKDATDQLRRLHHVSLRIVARDWNSDASLYLVVAQASTDDGRSDESIGAVSTAKLSGEALANAIMKAETKAKRRVTLAICGLGMLDETEVETIRDAEITQGPPLPPPSMRSRMIDPKFRAQLVGRLQQLTDDQRTEYNQIRKLLNVPSLNADLPVTAAEGALIDRLITEVVTRDRTPTDVVDDTPESRGLDPGLDRPKYDPADNDPGRPF